MSIILDALKRSERERRLQKPPDLSQIYQENHPPRKSPVLWLIVIVVVLIAGVSGAYFLLKKNPVAENKTPSGTKIVDVAKKGTPPENQKSLRNFSAKPGSTATIQKEKSPESAHQKTLPTITKRRKSKSQEVDQGTEGVSATDTRTNEGRGNFLDTILARGMKKKEDMKAYGEAPSEEGGSPLAGLFSTRHKPESEATGVESTAVPPPSTPQAEAPSVPEPKEEPPPPGRDSSEILSTPKGITIIEPDSKKVAEAPKPVPENADQTVTAMQGKVSVPPEPGKEVAAKVPEKEKIVLVDDLPYETRQKYEDLEINVHIYDKNKEERRVFINMHSYKEGEKIEEGATLVAIIPEGIILDYGDGKVQMNVKK